VAAAVSKPRRGACGDGDLEGTGKVQGRYREGTGKVQGRYREGTGKVQGRQLAEVLVVTAISTHCRVSISGQKREASSPIEVSSMSLFLHAASRFLAYSAAAIEGSAVRTKPLRKSSTRAWISSGECVAEITPMRKPSVVYLTCWTRVQGRYREGTGKVQGRYREGNSPSHTQPKRGRRRYVLRAEQLTV
jgi:hypothetical protein